VQVAFEDDHSPAFGITAVYSGAMTLEGVDATPDATTTYCYAGASGFYADDGYNSWGIDFDNADFTHLLSIFEFNVAPDATEQDGIPAGIYTITEDYAPNTVTWATYDEEMTYLSTGTVTVERDGEEYKVTVDAVDEYDAPFKADFAGQIYYENTSEQASISPREVYVVCYGEKDGLTNWYITLVDRGYLTTRDAVGNCYYGSILHFDLRSDAANDYTDGVPEGTFAVQNGQSGVGIWGGDNAACTSFLAEYFSGSPRDRQADGRQRHDRARRRVVRNLVRRADPRRKRSDIAHGKLRRARAIHRRTGVSPSTLYGKTPSNRGSKAFLSSRPRGGSAPDPLLHPLRERHEIGHRQLFGALREKGMLRPAEIAEGGAQRIAQHLRR